MENPNLRSTNAKALPGQHQEKPPEKKTRNKEQHLAIFDFFLKGINYRAQASFFVAVFWYMQLICSLSGFAAFWYTNVICFFTRTQHNSSVYQNASTKNNELCIRERSKKHNLAPWSRRGTRIDGNYSYRPPAPP